jgi:hypothetical protein
MSVSRPAAEMDIVSRIMTARASMDGHRLSKHSLRNSIYRDLSFLSSSALDPQARQSLALPLINYLFLGSEAYGGPATIHFVDWSQVARLSQGLGIPDNTVFTAMDINLLRTVQGDPPVLNPTFRTRAILRGFANGDVTIVCNGAADAGEEIANVDRDADGRDDAGLSVWLSLLPDEDIKAAIMLGPAVLPFSPAHYGPRNIAADEAAPEKGMLLYPYWDPIAHSIAIVGVGGGGFGLVSRPILRSETIFNAYVYKSTLMRVLFRKAGTPSGGHWPVMDMSSHYLNELPVIGAPDNLEPAVTTLPFCTPYVLLEIMTGRSLFKYSQPNALVARTRVGIGGVYVAVVGDGGWSQNAECDAAGPQDDAYILRDDTRAWFAVSGREAAIALVGNRLPVNAMVPPNPGNVENCYSDGEELWYMHGIFTSAANMIRPVNFFHGALAPFKSRRTFRI